jgi:hypothetical protein
VQPSIGDLDLIFTTRVKIGPALSAAAHAATNAFALANKTLFEVLALICANISELKPQ